LLSKFTPRPLLLKILNSLLWHFQNHVPKRNFPPDVYQSDFKAFGGGRLAQGLSLFCWRGFKHEGLKCDVKNDRHAGYFVNGFIQEFATESEIYF